jgi:hypothetical protein
MASFVQILTSSSLSDMLESGVLEFRWTGRPGHCQSLQVTTRDGGMLTVSAREGAAGFAGRT